MRPLPTNARGFAQERCGASLFHSQRRVLDAPEHGGSWEEIWRSLEEIEFVDLDFVVAYALRLGSALTIARFGLFLEQHTDELLVEERHLEIDHPVRGRMKMPGMPIKMDGGVGVAFEAAPLLGAHTDEVLAGIGLAAEEIADLRRDGVI